MAGDAFTPMAAKLRREADGLILAGAELSAVGRILALVKQVEANERVHAETAALLDRVLFGCEGERAIAETEAASRELREKLVARLLGGEPA